MQVALIAHRKIKDKSEMPFQSAVTGSDCVHKIEK